MKHACCVALQLAWKLVLKLASCLMLDIVCIHGLRLQGIPARHSPTLRQPVSLPGGFVHVEID